VGRRVNGGPAEYIDLSLYGLDNRPVDAGEVELFDDGGYRIHDVPGGTYIVAAAGGQTWSQLFAGVDCVESVPGSPVCPFASATPVTVSLGASTGGIDFAVLLRGSRRGRVVDAASGAPIAGIAIDLWNAGGQRVDTNVTGADGRFAVWRYPHLPVAPHRLSTDNAVPTGHVDEVYDDRQCVTGSVFVGNCTLDGATTVDLPADRIDLPEILIELEHRYLLLDGFE
jgi:hypothetical protein